MEMLTHACVHSYLLLHTSQLMTSIKTVLIEMLSTFEAKGKMGAKQLKEQLHMGWPVPSSQGYLEQLRKELKAEMRQQLEVVRWWGGVG